MLDNRAAAHAAALDAHHRPTTPPPAAATPAPVPQCLQYKTDQQSDLRKVEKLNLQMLALMATGAPPTGARRAGAGALARAACLAA